MIGANILGKRKKETLHIVWHKRGHWPFTFSLFWPTPFVKTPQLITRIFFKRRSYKIAKYFQGKKSRFLRGVNYIALSWVSLYCTTLWNTECGEWNTGSLISARGMSRAHLSGGKGWRGLSERQWTGCNESGQAETWLSIFRWRGKKIQRRRSKA